MCDKKVFAKNLAKVLLEKKLTQKEFAEKIGVNKSSVSLYLQGANMPSEKVVDKIVEVLEIPIEILTEKFVESKAEKSNLTISVEETAELLGRSIPFVQWSLRENKAPFGFAVKMSTHWTYCVSRAKLYDFLGIRGE